MTTFCFCSQTVDGNFFLSFTYRFQEPRSGTVYFAFCYPWSYEENQAKMFHLEKTFKYCRSISASE